MYLCSPEAICDPQADLDRFSKLGMGMFSSPEMERWSARGAFFAATRLKAVDALVELRDTCLPIFSEAKRFWDEQIASPVKVTWPVMRFVTEPAGIRALFVRDWDTLDEGASQCPIIARLNEGFKQWCTKYHFTERWLADSALTNLAMWNQSEIQRGEICWLYPSSFISSCGPIQVGGRQQIVLGQSASGLGLKPFKRRFLAPSEPPYYNPYTETWADYEMRLETYRRETESAIESLGLPRRRSKRARTADSSAHFVWLVQYHMLGWTREQVAKQYDVRREDGEGLDPSSVGEALKKLADAMDMKLRPARGRPRGKQ